MGRLDQDSDASPAQAALGKEGRCLAAGLLEPLFGFLSSDGARRRRACGSLWETWSPRKVFQVPVVISEALRRDFQGGCGKVVGNAVALGAFSTTFP